jgi:hypothetical protein
VKYWLLAVGRGIWIDHEPPPETRDEILREEFFPSRRDWAEFLRDTDPRDQLTPDFVAILRRHGMVPTPASPDFVRDMVADMLWRRSLRLWRRHGLPGDSTGVASAQPAQPRSSRRIVVPGASASMPSVPGIIETVKKKGEEIGGKALSEIEKAAAGIIEPIEALVARVSAGLLTWYEFRLVDEAEGGIAGVKVVIDTPAGRHDCVTDGGGVARVDMVPPAKASATIDADTLATALATRVEQPRRLPKPPQERDDFHVTTPRRAGKAWDLEMEQPHEVMIVSRADVRIGGTVQAWRDLALDDSLAGPCRLDPDTMIGLALCSWGQGRSGLVSGTGKDPHNAPAERPLPAVATTGRYVVKSGDSFWGLADRFYGEGWRYTEIEAANADLLAGRPPNMIHPGDVLRIPGMEPAPLPSIPDPWPAAPEDPPIDWIDMDVDGLHEALFDGDASDWFDRLAMPLRQPPDPPPPDWDPPVDAATAYAANSAALTLQHGPDPGEAVITGPVDSVAPPPAPPQVG